MLKSKICIVDKIRYNFSLGKSAPTLVFLVDDQAIKVLPGFQSRLSILDAIEQLNLSNAPMVS
jgi:hypothetical protein